MQIALDIILGFDESLLTNATIESCTEAFSVWNDGLFSFPINMPGTGAPSLSFLGCLQLSVHQVDGIYSRLCCAAFNKAIKAKKILMGYLDQNLELLKEKKRK